MRRGFTVIELLIAMSAGSILMLSVFGITIVYYGRVSHGQVVARMTVDSQNILRGMVDELRVASGVRTTNQLTDSHAPAGGWSTSAASAILIISTPAVNDSNEYIIDSNTAQPYQNEIIYFAEGFELYKRTLANPNATGNTATTTCPAASASASCPADRVLTEDYNSLNFTFYDQNDAVTAVPESARSIAVTINLARQAYGGDPSITNNIRITLRNL